ncbi:MAG TPA: hypothetical protein VN655_16210 [Pseudolabrys sp.]|jgi:hypothetical protein|nr:hypothetical protein [Pseudolabrys sp.]
MKRIVIATAVLAAAAFGSIGAASAQGVVVGAGPSGVYVGTGYHHHRHWRHDYDYARCRTVVTTRWHHGHRVTVRRRICD